MKGFRAGIIFLAVACVTLAGGACARKSGETATRVDSGGEAESESFTGTVTFLTGEVAVGSNGESKAIDVGDRVVEGDVVTTGADSTCEIQFGRFGSVHVSADTSLDVSRLSRDAGVTKSELLLGAGTVICKVRKLSGDDSFIIRTSTLVCGVRGTVFLVSHEEGKKTKVAVESGRVALAPGTADPAADPAASSDTLVVEAGFESVVRPEGDGKPLAEIAAPLPIAEDTKREFSLAPTLEIRDLPGDDGADGETGGEGISISLPVLYVTATPETAEVSVNGTAVSRGKFNALFNRGESVRLAVREEGFEPYEEVFVMEGGSELVRTVVLKASGSPSPAVSATGGTATEKAKPSVTETDPFETFVVPATGKKIKFAVADGSGKTLVSDESAVLSCLDEKGKVVWTADTGNGPNVNSAPVLAGKYAAYAGDKALAVFDALSGKRLWSMPLDASSSALFGRRPAISGATLFLGTGSGVSAFAASDGTAAGTVAIPDGTETTPSCRGSFLYAVSRSGVFVEIDIPSLSVKRKVPTGAAQPVATSVALAGDLAVFGDRKGTVTAVDLKDFAVKWQKKLSAERSHEVYADIAVSRDIAFVVARDTLYALSLASGTSVIDPVSGVLSPVVASSGAVWCAHSSGKVYGFSRTDATRVGERPVPGALFSGVAFNGDRLVAPLSDGRAAFIAPR